MIKCQLGKFHNAACVQVTNYPSPRSGFRHHVTGTEDAVEEVEKSVTVGLLCGM